MDKMHLYQGYVHCVHKTKENNVTIASVVMSSYSLAEAIGHITLWAREEYPEYTNHIAIIDEVDEGRLLHLFRNRPDLVDRL